MKRKGNLYHQIYSIENLLLADKLARKNKGEQYGIKLHDANKEANLLSLHEMLKNKTYKTSEYSVFKVYERKERDVYRLPYYPDRITHHAVMNIIKPVFVSSFTADTYSCIEGKGIHAAFNKLKFALHDIPGTIYCLKLDIKKFYPSIDHRILKTLLRRKFKDYDLHWLLDEIIDSAPGLPIGNYLSQFFANFYLTPFDHWIKEQLRLPYYFRYMDDIVILSDDKQKLHEILVAIKQFFTDKLNIEIKGNYQIFPVASRGVDFVGYVFYHTHIRVRKTIKQNFARMLANNNNDASISSYMGWLKHGNCNHLIKKLLQNEQLLRFQNRKGKQRVYRRKNRYQPNFECADNSVRI